MKTIQFTHNDLDGVACAIVAKLFIPGIEVYSLECGEADRKIWDVLSKQTETCTIIISDLSYNEASKDITIELLSKHRCIIADHHASSVWMNDIFSRKHEILAEEDGDLCGAKLLYTLLHRKYGYYAAGNKLTEFLDSVNSWDTWTWVNDIKTSEVTELLSNKSVYLNYMYLCFGFEEFIKIITYYLCQPSIKSLIYTSDMKTKLNKFIDEMSVDLSKSLSDVKLGVLKYDDNELKVLYTTNYNYQASLIALLLSKSKLYKDADLIMIEGENSISLRNGKNLDLSELAKDFGGGGHYSSAGIPLDKFDKSLINFE